jgi:hypothetical protein
MLVERTTIDAPADRIWTWLAGPERILRWNSPWVEVEGRPKGPFHEGETFWVTQRLGRRQIRSRVTVSRLVPHRSLVLLYAPEETRGESASSGSRIGTHREATETIELEELRGDRTRVVATVDLRRAGLPLPVRWLVELVHRFGKPRGEPRLARLRRLVETDELRQDPEA